MSTKASLAYRSIVLVGTKGAGKATIANSLLQEKVFPVGNVLRKKEKWLNQSTVVRDNINFVFHMVESIPDEKTLLESNLPNDISLVVFVFRYGCFTDEERKLFESIVGCFNENLSQLSALVITGCDDLSEESKVEFKKSLGEHWEIGKLLAASSMTKGTYCVTLPDSEKLSAKNADVYKDDIQHSHKEMQELLANCTTTWSLEKLIKSADQISDAKDLEFSMKSISFSKWKCRIL